MPLLLAPSTDRFRAPLQPPYDPKQQVIRCRRSCRSFSVLLVGTLRSKAAEPLLHLLYVLLLLRIHLRDGARLTDRLEALHHLQSINAVGPTCARGAMLTCQHGCSRLRTWHCASYLPVMPEHCAQPKVAACTGGCAGAAAASGLPSTMTCALGARQRLPTARACAAGGRRSQSCAQQSMMSCASSGGQFCGQGRRYPRATCSVMHGHRFDGARGGWGRSCCEGAIMRTEAAGRQ